MPFRARLAALLLVSVTACIHRGPQFGAGIPPASGDWRTAFALQVLDITQGTGAPAEPRKCIYAHYTGWLTNGTKFDSSHDTMPDGTKREPLSFPQGARRVIVGWDVGFEGMHVGGKRRLLIPYQLAYGERGTPGGPIPPQAPLVFDVELMGVADTLPRAPGTNFPRCPEWRTVSAATAQPQGTAQPANAGTWSSAPSMRHPRAAHAVVVANGAIYALAGTGEGRAPVLEVERFDGSSWSAETTLPGDGLNAPAAAVIGDRIYLIGGFNTTTNIPTDRVLVYDTRTHAWSEAAPLPTPRGGHAAVVLDGKIHVFGGGNSQRTLADHDEYDPVTNTWTARAPLPQSEGSPAGVVYAGLIHAIGGRSGPNDFGDIYGYQPRLDQWSKVGEIKPRGTAGALELCDAIYVFGGESQVEHRSLADVLVLNFATGRLPYPAAPMPTARNFARAVLLNGSVYVVGGSPTPELGHAAQGSTIVERFVPPCAR